MKKTKTTKQGGQQAVDRFNQLLDDFKKTVDANPPRGMARVVSLSDLKTRSRTDDRYARLAMLAAENIGWAVPQDENPRIVEQALAWLTTNARETSEDGVVDEVNACRGLV